MRKLVLPGGVLACLLSGVAVGTAEDWPQFRGPGGRAVSTETGLPVKWGPEENLRWKADLPGRGVSGPVVAAGRIYVTAASTYQERRLHVLCFDAATGKKQWERQLAATGSTMCNPTTSMAGPTPVTDGRSVYALFATGDLTAFDRDGDLLWYRSLAGDYPDITNQVGMASSPVLAGDTLLLPLENAGDSFAAGLDKKTGANRWKVPRTRDINWVTPLVVRSNGKPTAVFQTSADVTAYEPDTGKVVWSYNEGKLANVPTPVAGDDLVFVAAHPFLALRPSGDKPEVVWKSSKLTAGFASPLYYQGRLYGLTGTGAICLDAGTGEVVWQQRINGKFWASPLLADGKLYVVNEEGTTTVIQLGDKLAVLAVNPLKDKILATPAISGGALYLRSDKHLFCIGARQ
jgi:outer membrane protein assembly factor BamB